MPSYEELKREVTQAGLLRPRPARYAVRAGIIAIALAATVGSMAVVDNGWLQMGNAVQLCFLGHDAGHRQIFASERANRWAGLAVSALVGINRTWWIEKHNRHHGSPNDPDEDPDINIPMLAFTAEQAERASGAMRLMISRQAVTFYPLTCLEALSLKISGVPTVLRGRSKNRTAEATVMIGHAVGYCAVVFGLLPPLEAVAFAAVHHAMSGIYLSATFAPNHKGMPASSEQQGDFLRQQVLSSRNVRPSRINDLIYGGLNYQIEHHLFPTMPRDNLGKARHLVRAYCGRAGVSYHETGPLKSQQEILQHLHAIGVPLRRSAA